MHRQVNGIELQRQEEGTSLSCMDGWAPIPQSDWSPSTYEAASSTYASDQMVREGRGPKKETVHPLRFARVPPDLFASDEA